MREALIPDDLCEEYDEICLIDYENPEGLNKSKVDFSHYVFSFILEGEKEIFASDGHVRLSDREFTLIGASACLMTEKRSQISSLYKSVLLTFSKKVLKDFKFKYWEKIQGVLTEDHFNVLEFGHDPFTLNFVNSLKIILKNNNQQFLEIKIQEILLYLFEKYPQQLMAFFNAHQLNRDITFRKIIENNISNNLRLDELAFLCNMSLSTFKRYFTKVYQDTPQKWMQKKRLEIAEYWLKEGKRPKEIYANLGYASLSNFLRAYKNHFGVSARQHQNELL